MRKDWVGEKVDISKINRGKEYTIDDNLEISAINSIVKNSIYASEIAEEVMDKIENFNPELATKYVTQTEFQETKNNLLSRIQVNSNSIVSLNEGVASNTSSINQLQEQLNSLEFSPEEIEQLRQDVADAVETTNNFASQVIVNSQSINDNKTELLRINDVLTSHDNRINNNVAEIVKNTNAIESQSAVIQQQSSDIQQLRNDVDSLSINPDEINELKTSVNQAVAKVEELNETVGGFDTRITENTNNIDTNKQDIATNKDNIESNASNIEKNTNAINDLSKKVDDLNLSQEDIADLKESVKDISQMKEDIETNKASISNNSQSISDLESEFGNLETDFGNLSTLVGGFDERISNVESQTNSNSTTIGAHTTQIENINNRLDNLSVTPEDIQQLQQSVNNLSNEIPQIKSDIETNSNDILINKNSIDGHTQSLNSQASLIQSNKTAIEKNAEDISKNESAILKNSEDILSTNNRIDNLDLSPEDVAELKASVDQFSEDIGELQTSVTGNTSNIASNTNNINNNSSLIEANRVAIANKQETLVSGVNIKTINNKSILGSGNMDIDKAIKSLETLPNANDDSPSFINLLNDNDSNNLYRNKLSLGGFDESNLTNTIWEFGDGLQRYATMSRGFNINFNSAGYEFTQIYSRDDYIGMCDLIYYKADGTAYTVLDYHYESGGYYTLNYGKEYKTIHITGGADVTNTELINWLRSNATYIKYEYVKLQDKISKNNKLSADFIEETETKTFVSEEDRTTWDNKQNKLIQGSNITLTENADGTTTISSTGSGGGEGGGSSVEINSTDTPVGVANFIKVNGLNYSVGSNNGSSSGNSSLPVGSIFSSALPQLDAGVHLLDGSTIALDGIYKDFVNLVKTLVNAGHNLTCSQEEYDNWVNITGSCGKFVLDETNNTLRLPIITTFIQGLTDLTNIGKSVEAGLPNITGELDQGDCQFGTHNFEAEGSFYNEPTNAIYMFARANGSENRGNVVYFDASRSSEIYGKSDTVQPPSVQYPYYIVLANSTKTDVEVNIDNIVSDLNILNSKVNVIGIQIKDDYINGTSGYRIWDNGYCEQWGLVTSGNYTTIQYLKEFADTDYNLLVTNNSPTSYNGTIPLNQDSYNTKSTTGFTAYADGNLYKNWRAYGYLAQGEY